MENNHCKDCTYFHQHYGLDAKRLFRVFCGHCTAFKRIRKRLPDNLACDRFVPAPPQETAFVTKEDLSKTLLEYVMQLELLPQITDTQDR